MKRQTFLIVYIWIFIIFITIIRSWQTKLNETETKRVNKKEEAIDISIVPYCHLHLCYVMLCFICISISSNTYVYIRTHTFLSLCLFLGTQFNENFTRSKILIITPECASCLFSYSKISFHFYLFIYLFFLLFFVLFN